MLDIDISKLGKGLKRQPLDNRDYKYSRIMSAVPVDWSVEFRNAEPPDSDQGTAGRCVAEAASYFHWELKGERFSPRDIYSQVYLPGGGAYMRDGARIICSVGQQTLAECGDPSPNNESNNRIKCGNPELALDGLEASYFSVDAKSIEAVAIAIRDDRGCDIGVQGDDIGWQDIVNPEPPVNPEWGHALHLFGFHLHNGQKCVIAKSSWCKSGVTEHHIKENYFTSNNTFDADVIIRKPMVNVPQNIIVHHSITPRDLDPNTTEASIERNHKARGFPISSLGWHIGYHYMIFGNGEVRKYRVDTEEGAHCVEQSMNFKSIGICLIGDFDNEMPSQAQINSLRDLMQRKLTTFGINSANIYPHRHFAIDPVTGLPYKSCFGDNLPDNWARNIINQEPMIIIHKKSDINTKFALASETKIGFADFPAYLNFTEDRPVIDVALDDVEFDKIPTSKAVIKT
jgi:hypothetical protein